MAASVAAAFSITSTATITLRFSPRMIGKSGRIPTLNLGLRTEVLGAFHDDRCHIGNFDPQLGNNGQYPFVYGSCANKLGVEGLTGAGNNTTYHNNYSTGRVSDWPAWDVFGHHNTTVRGGYGIYFVRDKDVGTVDQLSFQAPFLPIAGAPAPPGCLATFFSPDAPSPQCDQIPGQGNFNALPAAGVYLHQFHPMPRCISGLPGRRHDRVGELWLRGRQPRGSSFSESFRANSASPFRCAQYAAMEIHHPA